MIKCICFDMDNTLYSESAYVHECYAEIARIICPNEKEKIFKTMLNIRQREGDREVFQKISKQYNLDREYISKFVEIYRTYNAKILLYPDAEIYIRNKKNNLKYGILTNGAFLRKETK